MGGHISIADTDKHSVDETADDTFTDALDIGASGNALVAVTTSGAATLTVEFSLSGEFSGEQHAVTVDYASGQSDQLEQFADLPFRYVRAKVDTNLTDVSVYGGGV